MNGGCEVRFSVGLWSHFLRVPKSVSKRLPRVYRDLRTHPRSGANIRKLRRWRDLYRYRIGDHRLVYRVESEQSRCAVTWLFLGHRGDVYRDLGHDPDREAPTIRVVENEGARPFLALPSEKTNENDQPTAGDRPLPADFSRVLDELEVAGDDRRALRKCRTDDELLECKVSPELLETVMDALWPMSIPKVDSPLPARFHRVLDRLEIPAQALTALQECRTESELLDCEVSQALLDRISYALWPRLINRAANEPKRVIDSSKGIEEAVSGTRPPESFLLALDKSQRPIVEGFARRPAGPRIVKGGPGTGKSTVGLYCLRNLIRSEQTGLFSSPRRILFTTFTRALVAASRQLLGELGVDADSVDLRHVDSLAKRHARSPWANPVYEARWTVWKDTVGKVVRDLRERIGGFSWTEDDSGFLFDEMNLVIVGRGITSQDEYLSIKRVGRGRKMGQRQRRHVWDFACAAWEELKSREHCLRAHLFVDATRHADPVYDYVFIDEAQDLPPVAIRMCVKLAKDARNVFLTADRNQSIYNPGFSWSEVHESLNMRGRSTILRRNHRTTQEIMHAIRPLLADDERVDPETRDTESVRRGLRPELRRGNRDDEINVVSQWFKQVVAEEPDLDMANVAVLCPTRKDCERIARGLDALRLSAKYMTKDDVEIGYDGIKVMTIHTAKGLQFPIVAVVGLEEGRVPFTDMDNPEQREDTDRWRRVFFVACSRAMRRLLVVADKARPSPFVADFDKERWIIS